MQGSWDCAPIGEAGCRNVYKLKEWLGGRGVMRSQDKRDKRDKEGRSCNSGIFDWGNAVNGALGDWPLRTGSGACARE